MTSLRFEGKKKYYIQKYGKKEGMKKFNIFMERIKQRKGPHKRRIANRKDTNTKVSTNISKSFRFLFF